MKCFAFLKVAVGLAVATMLVACAPKAAHNSDSSAKENGVQDKVERDSTSASQVRSTKDIMAVFKENTQTRLKGIYNDFLRKRPRFQGKIVVRITVISSGDVKTVEIVSATTDYPEFEKAISDDLMQWKYGSGDYVDCTFTIPLTFSDD